MWFLQRFSLASSFLIHQTCSPSHSTPHVYTLNPHFGAHFSAPAPPILPTLLLAMAPKPMPTTGKAPTSTAPRHLQRLPPMAAPRPQRRQQRLSTVVMLMVRRSTRRVARRICFSYIYNGTHGPYTSFQDAQYSLGLTVFGQVHPSTGI